MIRLCTNTVFYGFKIFDLKGEKIKRESEDKLCKMFLNIWFINYNIQYIVYNSIYGIPMVLYHIEFIQTNECL